MFNLFFFSMLLGWDAVYKENYSLFKPEYMYKTFLNV